MQEYNLFLIEIHSAEKLECGLLSSAAMYVVTSISDHTASILSSECADIIFLQNTGMHLPDYKVS